MARPLDVGDNVHYIPAVHDELNRDRRDKPLAATVTRLNEDGTLNLLVTDVRRGIVVARNASREYDETHAQIGGIVVPAAPWQDLEDRVKALEHARERSEA